MRLLKKINYCLIYNIIIGIFIEDVTYVLLVKNINQYLISLCNIIRDMLQKTVKKIPLSIYYKFKKKLN